MMALSYFLKKTRWSLMEIFSRRNFYLKVDNPIVSFTFDDFPKTALNIGGSILKSFGVSGTYYVSMGLMNKVNNLGEHFSYKDLEMLILDGHELGCHTFDHLSCRNTSLRSFKANVLRSINELNRYNKKNNRYSFSYPFGHITLRTKRAIGGNFSSCRGIIPGINKSPIDLNLLRANSIYSQDFDINYIERLFSANQKHKGWLIFYTHDISETPSPFGCKPSELESVIKMAIKRQNIILPVGQVLNHNQKSIQFI